MKSEDGTLRLVTPTTFQILDRRNAELVNVRWCDLRQVIQTWVSSDELPSQNDDARLVIDGHEGYKFPRTFVVRWHEVPILLSHWERFNETGSAMLPAGELEWTDDDLKPFADVYPKETNGIDPPKV